MLESAKRSHKVETEPTVQAVSALRVDLNTLMERISRRVADAGQQATAQQSTQQEEIHRTDDEDRSTTEQLPRPNPGLTSFNPRNPDHQM